MPTLITHVTGTVPTAADFNSNFSSLNNQIDSTSGQIRTGVGSVTAPTHTFKGDTDTGMYRSAADIVDITTGGLRTASFATVASGVNYIRVDPSATGASVTVDTEGTDTNVGLNISSSGTGTITLWTGASAREALILPNVASAVNEITITNAATGAGPLISTTGDDTNIDLRIDPKGSGNVTIPDNSALIPGAISGSPVTNGLYAENVFKCWGRANNAGTIVDSFNVSSITDVAAGRILWTWDTDFANANYVTVPNAFEGSANSVRANVSDTVAPVAGAAEASTFNNVGSLEDPDTGHHVCAIGDQ